MDLWLNYVAIHITIGAYHHVEALSMKTGWLLPGCLSIALLSQAALAQTIVVGSWTGDAYYDDTGRFSHCAVATHYVSGITLAFGVARDFSFRMVAGHEAWNMPVGSQYELVYQIDNYRPLYETAEAMTSNSVFISFRNAEELFDLLRKGYSLTIYSQGQRFFFDLKGSNRALTAVVDCVTNQIYLETARKNRVNPFETQRGQIASNSPPTKQLTVEQQTDITVFASNLLSQSGLTHFTLLAGHQIPDEYRSGFDVLWLAGGVVGGATFTPDNMGIAPDDIPSLIIARDSRACGADFASGMSEVSGSDLRAKRLFTACKERGGSLLNAAYYTTIPWPGGLLTITHLTSTTREEASEADEHAFRAANFLLNE
jgi:hypothetical protein